MFLVVFQTMFRKIFSDVWLCSWKYHRKHIFYLLLTFSRLPNDYIISFIPQNTNKTQKKIIKSEQTKVRSRSREYRSKDRDRRYRASRWCWQRDASIAIDAFTRCVDRDRDRTKIKTEIAIGATAPASDVAIDSFFLPPSLSLSSIFQCRKYFEVKIETENHFRCFGSQIWSTGNAFQFDLIWSNNQTPLFSGKSFPESVWSQFKRSLSFTTFLNNVMLYSCIEIILI